MSETQTFRLAVVGDNGKLDPEIIPGVAGGGGGGGPQCVERGFSGELVARDGKQFWVSPYGLTIRPVRLTAVLGTAPTVGTPDSNVVFRLMVNGSEFKRVTVFEGNLAGAADMASSIDIPGGSVLSIDVYSVPDSTPSKAADAVIQFWWKYLT